jgi:hypothetical protein
MLLLEMSAQLRCSQHRRICHSANTFAASSGGVEREVVTEDRQLR